MCNAHCWDNRDSVPNVSWEQKFGPYFIAFQKVYLHCLLLCAPELSKVVGPMRNDAFWTAQQMNKKASAKRLAFILDDLSGSPRGKKFGRTLGSVRGKESRGVLLHQCMQPEMHSRGGLKSDALKSLGTRGGSPVVCVIFMLYCGRISHTLRIVVCLFGRHF